MRDDYFGATAVGREFNRRMKKAFDARGIEIPFPHRTIYMGEPKEGDAPPMHVRLEKEIERRETSADDGEGTAAGSVG